jgi:trigger factor
MKVTNKTHEDLHVDYNDPAIESIKRSLAMRELIRAEGLAVTDEQIEAEIDKVISRFGEQAAAFRSIYDNETMRDNLRNDLLYRQLTERLVGIGKGEAPALTADVGEETSIESNEGSESEGETA